MKLDSLIICIFIFVWQPVSSMADQCVVERFDYFAENNNKRFGSIVMPSGATLTIVGHIHGSRAVQEELLNFSADRLSSDTASWIAQNEAVVLKHASEDYAFLLNELKQEQFLFVGAEINPKIYNTYQPRFLSFIEKVNFARLNPSEKRDLLLRTLQAPLYAKFFAEKVLGTTVSIIAMENSAMDGKPFVDYMESHHKFLNLLSNTESIK